VHNAERASLQGTEAKVKHAGDMHEVMTESTFDTARTRQFDLSLKDPTFSEIILTFNYAPSQSEGYVVQLKDDTWANMQGTPSKSRPIYTPFVTMLIPF
jgi:hypothetical protein